MTNLISADGLNFDSFDSMGLKQNLLKGIHEYGFKDPSEIQKRGIVPFTKGLDVIQQAQSGTGKTASFCIGILQQLDYDLKEIQALVLVPTSDSAQHVENVMKGLGSYLGVKVHACVGWISLAETRGIVSSGVHVVVGTPTCVFDFIWRKFITNSDHVKMIVLDEADELLSGDCFKDQAYHMFGLLPSKFQVGLFSATMPAEVVEITRKFMDNPVMIFGKARLSYT